MIRTAITAGDITPQQLQQAMIMASGQKWSDYVSLLAKPEQASMQDYARYIADTYKIDISTPGARNQIAKNTHIPPSEKALLLSHLDGQMQNANVPAMAKNYSDIVKNVQDFANSPYFTVLNTVNGGKLKPEDFQKTAEAAARGDGESMLGGKPISMIAGGIGLIFLLGRKNGEFSFWEGLKRAFFAIVGITVGCAA